MSLKILFSDSVSVCSGTVYVHKVPEGYKVKMIGICRKTTLLMINIYTVCILYNLTIWWSCQLTGNIMTENVLG